MKKLFVLFVENLLKLLVVNILGIVKLYRTYCLCWLVVALVSVYDKFV
jgi:hypothetical protein